MPTEIEAKFLDVNPNQVRQKLKKLGAVCEQPMRLMKRIMFDFPDQRFQKDLLKPRLRVRDEGDKVTMTYKVKNNTNYVHEIETTIGSFNEAVNILKAVGLISYSYQESKRETWKLHNVEVVLDQWPWLNDYIEVEGKNEEAIKKVAHDLGFDWKDAAFGSVDRAYRGQYPGMKKTESIGEVSQVRFDLPLPDYLEKRMKK